MSSGWSALVLCLILGKRKGFGKRAFPPHSLALTMVGTGMLWVGWYGFNAGSAVAADGIAANAFMTTTLATAVACCVWPLLEWITRGKPTVLGFCSGAVAGLVVITPAAGLRERDGRGHHRRARRRGSVPGLHQAEGDVRVRRRAGHLRRSRRRRHHGRARDRLPRHARTSTRTSSTNLADIVGNGLWIEQLKAMGVTLVLAVGGTVVIAMIVKATIGLRPTPRTRKPASTRRTTAKSGYHYDEAAG